MLPSTLWPPVLFWLLGTFTTSETLDTGTPRSSTALRMPLPDSFPDPRTWRRPPWTSGNVSRRTSTGRAGMNPRRTALDAAADVTRTLSMSRARTAPVWPNGSMSPVAGPRLNPREERGIALLLSSSFGNLSQNGPVFLHLLGPAINEVHELNTPWKYRQAQRLYAATMLYLQMREGRR